MTRLLHGIKRWVNVHKTDKRNQLSIVSNEQAYSISIWKAASIIAVSAIGLVVATAFTIAGTLNSDHFLVLANDRRITTLEQNTVRNDVLTEQLGPMRDDIVEIKTDIKELIRESHVTK